MDCRVLVGVAISNFLEHFCLVRELLVFVGIAALLVFVGANLVLIGMLVREAARGVVRYGRRTRVRITPQEQLYVSSDLPHGLAKRSTP